MSAEGSFPDLHIRALSAPANGTRPTTARPPAGTSRPPEEPHGEARTRGHLARIVAAVVTGAGSVVTAGIAFAGVVAWTIVGIVAGFTREWLDVLFAVSGAVTLIMVIFIQHTTARESRALMLKLDELLRVHNDASNRYIGAENTPLEKQEELEDDAANGR